MTSDLIQSKVQSMMIEEILKQQEGKNLEFKENAKPLEKILNTAVAFSNTAGGRIVIGIEDKTLKIIKTAHQISYCLIFIIYKCYL